MAIITSMVIMDIPILIERFSMVGSLEVRQPVKLMVVSEQMLWCLASLACCNTSVSLKDFPITLGLTNHCE